jgi:hypothetical protein
MSLRCLLAAATTALLTALALAPLPAQAAPAGASLTTKAVKGFQYETSCLSKKLCVLAGYNSFGTGDVVAVRNGTPGKVSVVHHTSRLYTVSCPNASGCVALADTSSGVGAEFVNINSSGVVTSTKTVSDAAGDTITEISCSKLTSCEVAGTNVFTTPWKIVAGTWNGKSLSLRTVPGPKNTTTTSVLGLSCAGGNCDVVGYSTAGAKIIGLSLVASGTRLGKLHTANGDSFYAVSCVSKSTCYAAGFLAQGTGLVVTVKDGAAGSLSKAGGELFGISCSGSACTAAGQMVAPVNSGYISWGIVVSVASGMVKTTTIVKPAFSLNGISRIGTFFTAVGSSQNRKGEPPSELVTG